MRHSSLSDRRRATSIPEALSTTGYRLGRELILPCSILCAGVGRTARTAGFLATINVQGRTPSPAIFESRCYNEAREARSVEPILLGVSWETASSYKHKHRIAYEGRVLEIRFLFVCVLVCMFV